MHVQADWNEWFKLSALVLQLYCTDERKIQKTNWAHLIKSLLSGNYLMKTFALKHLDFRQSRNWQKRKSCLLSKCLQQKNRALQTIGEEDNQTAKRVCDLQLATAYIHAAARNGPRAPSATLHVSQMCSGQCEHESELKTWEARRH